MAYSSLLDLQLRLTEAELIQLTDDQNLNQLDTALIEGAIAEADGVIDSFLQAQVTTPLVSPPALITTLSSDLALYRLHARRGLGVVEEVSKLKEQAYRLLEKIAKGELKILSGQTPAPAGASQVATGEAQFTPKFLGQM